MAKVNFDHIKLPDVKIADVKLTVEAEDPVATKKFLERFTPMTHVQFTPMKNFPTEDDDIFLGQIPKCGSTWLQQIVHQIRTGGDESFTNIQHVITMLITFKDAQAVAKAQAPYHPHMYKTHYTTYEDAMSLNGKRYINLIRDPVDCFWSWFNFATKVWNVQELPVRDFYFQIFQHAERIRCDYFQHLASWWPHYNDPHVLWVHYEDLKEDLPTCVDRLAEFMKVKLTPEIKAVVLERCSFQYMKDNSDKFNEGVPAVVEAMRRLAKMPPEEIAVASVDKVRPSGGQAGQGAKNVPEDVILDMQRRWREEVQPISGCANYAEMRNISSLLKRK